ncbi:DHA2 family efflux MFS transporter permease subunit [Nonomuraea sp. NPDC059023]
MATAAPENEDRLDAGVLKVAGVVVLGLIMSILDITVVSVAQPTFQQIFEASPANVAWSMTGYTLALATIIPVTGWAADRFGTKRLYLLALLLFVGGSFLCAMAWDVGSLIGFRVVQGLGGGMLMPLAMTIMARAAGPHRIGRVMAVLGVPMLLGPICGPILGGWLIEKASWHWIFLVNVPIGVAALVYALLALPRDRPKPSRPFDFVGMLLLSPGLALLLYGVSAISEEATVAAAKVLVPGVAGVVLCLAFVWHAFRPEHPLIDLRLFRNRQLAVAAITTFLFSVAFFGATLFIPSYFLQVRGEGTLTAGLLVAPQGIGAMITMPLAGRAVDRIGPGKIVVAGLIAIIMGMAVFTQVGVDTPYPMLLGALFVMGLGMGATMMPTMTAALQTLKDQAIAQGSTLVEIIQQVAASAGTAVMSVVLTSQINSTPSADDTASAFGATYAVGMALLVLTLVAAFFLPRRKPDEPGVVHDSELSATR